MQNAAEKALIFVGINISALLSSHVQERSFESCLEFSQHSKMELWWEQN